MPKVSPLRLARLERGLRLEDVAREIGRSTYSLSVWERGLARLPDADLVKLAKLYGSRIATLLGLDDSRSGS